MPRCLLVANALAYYRVLLSIVHTIYIESDVKILPAHYTWKVAFTSLINKQSIQVKLSDEGAHYTRMHTILV
jgi:hypothetical protein